jgi:hypothetical protein
MLLRATLVAAIIATAALAMAGLGPALGHADPNQHARLRSWRIPTTRPLSKPSMTTACSTAAPWRDGSAGSGLSNPAELGSATMEEKS